MFFFNWGEVACPWWVRNFSVLLQKVKIKIQNDLIDRQSASPSVNEDVRINFKQSHQCFNALKCPKIVKKFEENYGAPPPPCLERRAADNLSKLVFLDQNVDRLYSAIDFFRRSTLFFRQSTLFFRQSTCSVFVSKFFAIDYIRHSSRGSTSRARSAMLCKY